MWSRQLSPSPTWSYALGKDFRADFHIIQTVAHDRPWPQKVLCMRQTRGRTFALSRSPDMICECAVPFSLTCQARDRLRCASQTACSLSWDLLKWPRMANHVARSSTDLQIQEIKIPVHKVLCTWFAVGLLCRQSDVAGSQTDYLPWKL